MRFKGVYLGKILEYCLYFRRINNFVIIDVYYVRVRYCSKFWVIVVNSIRVFYFFGIGILVGGNVLVNINE